MIKASSGKAGIGAKGNSNNPYLLNNLFLKY